LSPFLEKEVLKQVFGKNLFEDENLKTYLLQLYGVGEQKPFECVGTIEEVNIAIAMRIRRNPASEKEVLLYEWLNQPFAKQYLAQTDTDFCFTPQKDHNLLPRDYEIFSEAYSVIKKAELRRMLSSEKIAILGFGREGKSSLNLLKEIMPKQNLIVADGNEDLISQNIYTAGQPDPDIIVRPSGEYRLSNFLTWQSAYSEFWFSDILWPDFTTDDVDLVLEDYQKRHRRFGGV
jgi:hypothetical protein